MSKRGPKKFDTRISFTELCRRTGINARQRIVMIRYLKQNMKGGEQKDEE